MGDSASLASTCERRDEEARRPGSEGQRTEEEGKARPCGQGKGSLSFWSVS